MEGHGVLATQGDGVPTVSQSIHTLWNNSGHLQYVVSILRLRLEREVRRVLVWGVVPQRELHSATVDTRALTVRASEIVHPGDASEELALNGRRALRGAVGLVQEDRVTGVTVILELRNTGHQREREIKSTSSG